MGRRSTKLYCENCKNDWWEPFEHLDKSDALDFVEDTCCPDCGEQKWTLTFRSQFSGGLVKPNPPTSHGNRLRGFQCMDCYEEFHEWLGEVTPDELRTVFQSLTCPACDSQNWKLTDSYKFIKGRNPTAPIYITVASESSST